METIHIFCIAQTSTAHSLTPGFCQGIVTLVRVFVLAVGVTRTQGIGTLVRVFVSTVGVILVDGAQGIGTLVRVFVCILAVGVTLAGGAQGIGTLVRVFVLTVGVTLAGDAQGIETLGTYGVGVVLGGQAGRVRTGGICKRLLADGRDNAELLNLLAFSGRGVY